MGKRVAYLLAGYGVGSLLGLALWSFTGKYHVWPVFLLGNSLGLLFTQWAEHAGKVKTVDELHRPLTLFPRD